MKIDPNKIKWVHVASRGKNHAVLLIDSIGTLSMQNKYPETLYDFPYTAKYYLQCNGSRHLAKNDVDAMINILHKRLRQQPDFFYHYGVKMKGLSLELREWIDEVKNTKWKQLDNTKIAKIIFKHCQLTAKIWAIPFNYAYYFFLNDIVIEQFIKDIKKRLGKNFEKQHIAILTPDKNSEIATERIALLKLALQTTKNKTVDKQKLEAHWKRFAHLNNYYYWGNGYSLDNMFDRLNEETKKGALIIQNELDQLKQSLVNYNLFTEKEKIIIKSIKMAGYALQFTDESLAYAIHHIRGVYTEAAKRLGLSYNQFVSMRLTEVQASLKNNKLAVNENELNKRYHDHLLLVVDGESFIDTGKIYNKFLARTKSGRAEKQQGLKGVAAYEGDLVRGKVHIITNENEIKSFKKGEILVTPMTNPTFVPAMRKAAAILTDDGGLLCHAAIVSREMKKPCLIGTKNATKILKNGDVIEVDTNKGTVKIL